MISLILCTHPFSGLRSGSPAIFPGCVTEPLSILIGDPAKLQALNEIRSEENKVIDNGSHGAEFPRQGIEQDGTHKECPVEPADIFNLDWKDKEQKDFKVGKQIGKRQEQGQVQVLCRNGTAADKSRGNGAEYADQVIQVKAKTAPLMFQVAAYQIVKVQSEHNLNGTGGGRQKQKGDQTPYFPVQDPGWNQGKFAV